MTLGCVVAGVDRCNLILEQVILTDCAKVSARKIKLSPFWKEHSVSDKFRA